ncbi:MAG: flagellar protein FlgN [Phycisphaerales bacterium]
MTTPQDERTAFSDENGTPIDPHAHPSVWKPRLERLIERQIELYETLLQLTSEQAGLIEREEGEALLALLQSRQAYVDEVAQHNEAIEPFVRDWESLSALLGENDRVTLSARLEALLDLIDRMVNRDEAGREAIAARRDRITSELGSLTTNKNAVTTYARSGATNPPRYQDRRA